MEEKIMNEKIAYIAMYRALDCRQEETKNIELSEYLDFVNPYVFKDRKSADPAYYAEYIEWLKKNNSFCKGNNSYEIIKKYLKDKTNFYDLFIDISKEEWDKLESIVKKEEENNLQNCWKGVEKIWQQQTGD